MKRKSSMFLAGCLAASILLSGCAAPKQEAARDSSEYQVAMMIPGNLGDKSFFDAAFESVGMLKSELGLNVDYVEAGGDSSKYYSTYVDLCEKKYDLILTVSSNGDDALVQVADEFPEQKFINLDGELVDIPENIFIMAPKNNEMSYLAGVVAALKAQELGDKKVGFIGGMDIPGINEFLIGYIEGVQFVDENMKVTASYVGSFTDTAKGKENGLLMYDTGVSVVFAAAGQSGLGVIDAAAQKNKFVIGVDSDQAEALKASKPELAEVIITSAIKNIPEEAVLIVERAQKNEVAYGQREFFGIKEGAVGIAENEFYQKIMKEEERRQVETIKEQIIKGEIDITDTSTLTQEELEIIRTNARP